MKKLFAMFAASVMAALSMFAATINVGNFGLTYLVGDDNNVTITDCSDSQGALTIPGTIDGNPVTSIGERAFYYCTVLTSVTIPDSVTSIGDYAFYGDHNIKTITIDQGDLERMKLFLLVKGVEVWAVNFEETGDDVPEEPKVDVTLSVTKAIVKPTGKRDGAGNEMFVWQDYVACTDPTNPEDVFRASITIVNGQPVISWTPEQTAEQAALRTYRKWGKVRLTDADWTEIEAGHEGDYNFYKVTVEMK